MSDRVWYLQKCGLFEHLPDAELTELESRARVRKIPRNGTIYFPQDDADAVYVVLDGRVRLVSITRDGKQAMLALFEPGDLFGELALAGADRRDDYAEAVLASEVLTVPRDAVEAVMERNPNLILAVTKLIGWRRRRLERRLRSLLFASNRERLTSLLWDLLEQYGRCVTDGVLLDIKLSHQDLANLIGVTRESVTLALGELQSEGVVNLGRQRIVVRNLEGLARLVDERVPQRLIIPPPPRSGIVPAARPSV